MRIWFDRPRNAFLPATGRHQSLSVSTGWCRCWTSKQPARVSPRSGDRPARRRSLDRARIAGDAAGLLRHHPAPAVWPPPPGVLATADHSVRPTHKTVKG